MRRATKIQAASVLASGLIGAFGLFLFATGRHKDAYALGIGLAITGATIGAVRVLAADEAAVP